MVLSMQQSVLKSTVICCCAVLTSWHGAGCRAGAELPPYSRETQPPSAYKERNQNRRFLFPPFTSLIHCSLGSQGLLFATTSSTSFCPTLASVLVLPLPPAPQKALEVLECDSICLIAAEAWLCQSTWIQILKITKVQKDHRDYLVQPSTP